MNKGSAASYVLYLLPKDSKQERAVMHMQEFYKMIHYILDRKLSAEISVQFMIS